MDYKKDEKMQLETDIRAARLVWIADKQEDSASLSPILFSIQNTQCRCWAFREDMQSGVGQ